MLPAYGPLTAAWVLQWSVLWISWLVWPLIGWLAWRLVRQRRALSREQTLRRALALVLALWFVEMRFIEPALIVERTTVLNLGFQARLALISDYHLGLYNSRAFLERVVDRLNAMPLDAVLIAGDHLNKPDRPLSELLAPLARLRHPAFSVPGNHDESRPGPPVRDELRRTLLALGVTPVEYRHVALERFTLVGLGDHFAGRDGIAPVLAAPADKPRIVLMHNPDSAMALPPGSAVLALAGHTHGGQIRIPLLYRYAIPCFYPFDRGLHTFSPVPTFVTSGLGQTGLPMRFLNPPVIDVLEIR
jgi:predicted MPP superfamily phosphohydrolase